MGSGHVATMTGSHLAATVAASMLVLDMVGAAYSFETPIPGGTSTKDPGVGAIDDSGVR